MNVVDCSWDVPVDLLDLVDAVEEVGLLRVVPEVRHMVNDNGRTEVVSDWVGSRDQLIIADSFTVVRIDQLPYVQSRQ